MKEIQKNRITIISRNEYERADIETQSKQFYFQDNLIRYQNKLEIVENNQPKINGVNVVNNLCSLQNNKLVKTTVIYFEDKLIRIQDEFYLQNYCNNVKVENQSTLIKKPITNNVLPQIIPLNSSADINSSSISLRLKKKKDLKNIVKNIVKIFINWVDKSLSYADDCKKIMNELLESHKYNNALLKAISENPLTNKAFLSFLLTAGEELVQASRIHDKKTHLDTLKRYKMIFEKGENHQPKSTTLKNGSAQGGSQEYKVEINSQKYKQESNSENNFVKMQFADRNEQNENKGSSKGSDSDKMFSKSNSHENRNRDMMSSSNADNYPSGEGISNRDNLIFFSSSGSDQ